MSTRSGSRHSLSYGRAYARVMVARKQAIISSYKSARGCMDCGESHPACLDVHHRDPETKSPRLRGKSRIKWVQFSYEDLAAELEKCDVVCANCHRKRHAVDQSWHTETADV